MPATNFTHEQVKKRAFLRAAKVLYEHWEEGTGPHSRLFDILLNHVKSDLIVGRSVAASATGTGGPEHVMPCAFICKQCLELFNKGKPVEDVAAYIDAHLKIVIVTKEERRKLDSKKLGLKNKMPPGWKDGDDIMDRLKAASIEYVTLTPSN